MGRLLEAPTVKLDWERFGVLDTWSLMGGGRLREEVTHGGSNVIITQINQQKQHHFLFNFRNKGVLGHRHHLAIANLAMF